MILVPLRDLDASLAARFAGVDGVEDVVRHASGHAKELTSPFVLLAIASMAMGDDLGIGGTVLLVSYEARIAVAKTTEDAALVAASLAASLIEVVKAPAGVEGVSKGRLSLAQPDPFDVLRSSDDRVGLEVWLIEWEHQVVIGENVWAETDPLPTEVLVGISPRIGLGNEEHYVEAAGAPE